MAFHYGVYERQAALGPISETEWQAHCEALAKQKAERETALAAAAESTQSKSARPLRACPGRQNE